MRKSININVLDKNLLDTDNLKINDFNEDLINISGDQKKLYIETFLYKTSKNFKKL